MERILTFDCYGTLINTDSMYNEIFKIGQEHGFDGTTVQNIFINYEDRLMYGESYKPYNELVYEALGYCDMELNANVIQQEFDRVIEAHKMMSPHPHVVETLKSLKGMGYTLVMMSNCVPEIMAYNHQALGNVFDRIFLASDTKCYKPQIGFFQHVENTLALKNVPHCHIAAGYWWDIVPATHLGWNKIWVNRKNRHGSPMHMPYHEIQDLSQVLPVLKQLGI